MVKKKHLLVCHIFLDKLSLYVFYESVTAAGIYLNNEIFEKLCGNNINRGRFSQKKGVCNMPFIIHTVNSPAFIMPGDFGDVSWPAVVGILIIAVCQLLVFSGALMAVIRLWHIVFDVIAGADTKFVKAVTKMIGSAEIKRGHQFSFLGVGLLGTLLIVLIAGWIIIYGFEFVVG